MYQQLETLSLTICSFSTFHNFEKPRHQYDSPINYQLFDTKHLSLTLKLCLTAISAILAEHDASLTSLLADWSDPRPLSLIRMCKVVVPDVYAKKTAALLAASSRYREKPKGCRLGPLWPPKK